MIVMNRFCVSYHLVGVSVVCVWFPRSRSLSPVRLITHKSTHVEMQLRPYTSRRIMRNRPTSLVHPIAARSVLDLKAP